MPRRTIASLAALAACTAVLPAAALAQSTTPTNDAPQIESAFLTTGRISPKDPKLAMVVIKTKAPLERRADGHILYGAKLDKIASSLGGVKAKSTKRCYVAYFRLTRSGRLQAGGSIKPGTSHTISIARDNGSPITRTLKASAPRKGDAQGKRLGC